MERSPSSNGSPFAPDDSGYKGNLGAAYLQVADFDTAISEFEAALKNFPRRMQPCTTTLTGAQIKKTNS